MAGLMIAAQQPALHDLEGFRLLGARLRLAVIDEQPRQIEHAGHPGDHRDDVERLEPVVQHPTADSCRVHLPRIAPACCSTWAIGVSGRMPCPRLKMKGRREGVQHRIDLPIERRAAGDQHQRIEIALHRRPRLWIRSRANPRSTIQSSPTASTGTSLDIARQAACRRRAESR